MALVEVLGAIESNLPEDWSQARLKLAISDPGQLDRGAALLGPAAPARRGNELLFVMGRGGSASGPEHIRRLLRKLDRERISAQLELVESMEAAPPAARASAESLVEAWDAAVDKLPSDWSDLWCEVELISSDFLERAALDMAPVNPASFGDRQGFRFRCARRFGYGASPGMVRACFARCDRDGIRGTVRILRALSDTAPVGTQGPVWYVGGRVV